VRASIGVVAKNEDRLIYVISKYLSRCFLAYHPLEAHLSHTISQQGAKPQRGCVCVLEPA
jgi:hypothetical protein